MLGTAWGAAGPAGKGGSLGREPSCRWEPVWGERGRSWLGLWGSVGLKDVKAAAHGIVDFSNFELPVDRNIGIFDHIRCDYTVSPSSPRARPRAQGPIFALAQPLQASGKHG